MVAGHAYKWAASLESPYGEVPSNVVAVELGLPSGMKWANMNVGATSVTDFGTYFAWGEITGCQRGSDGTSCIPATMDGYLSTWTGGTNSNYVSGNTKSTYDWTNYKWGPWGSAYSYKYVTSSVNGKDDNRTTLEPCDDAAAVNWGGNWRMPTLAEQLELCNNCYWAWTDSYNGSGIKGYIVYKAKNSSDKRVIVKSGGTPSSSYSLSDNHIFLPCTGERYSGSFYDDGSWGFYWSSSIYTADSYIALCLQLYLDGISVGYPYERYYGFNVRAVCP